MIIIDEFPPAPALVRHALAELAIVRSGDVDAIAELGEIATLPRPWLPGACPHELRHHIWLWCDQVVTWINANYVWRPTHLIPDCWLLHPHIANELPALACDRLLAHDAVSPEHLEDWHRYTLPTFLERLAHRLGESSCRTGKHTAWPAAARHQSGIDPEHRESRADLIFADTHPPQQLRPTAT